MSDPRKANPDPGLHEHSSLKSFSVFQRIQVTKPSHQELKEYQDLSRPHQQELLSRLIDHVREL